MASRPKTPPRKPVKARAPKVRTFRIRIPFEMHEVGDVGGPDESTVRLGKGDLTIDFRSSDSLDVPVRLARTLKRLFGAHRSVVAFDALPASTESN